MRSDELEKMRRLEDTYWWFVARRRLVQLLARAHRPSCRGDQAEDDGGDAVTVADIGCGTGATLSAFTETGRCVGVDISDVALRLSADRGLKHLVRGRAEAIPLSDGQADMALCLDVLEHVDDEAATKELFRICRPGGVLIVTVPAYRWLWSEHDEALGHLRRYRAPKLRHVLEGAGFGIVKMTHVLSCLLLPISLFRWLQRLRRRPENAPKTALIELPGPLNTLLVWALAVELRVAAALGLPFGVSIACIARRPEQ